MGEFLQRPVIAQPGRSGGQPGQNQENPAFFTDLRNSLLGACHKNHKPRHAYYDHRGENEDVTVYDAAFYPTENLKGGLSQKP